jgi:hypothetical protein
VGQVHFYGGGWDNPNCARPTRAFRGRALREQRRLTGYTERGERSLELVGDRTRNLALHIESKIHNVGLFDHVVFAF